MAALPIQQTYLSHSISEPAFDDAGEALFYVRIADAKRAIVRHLLSSGFSQVITTEPMPKGGVGYGGGVYVVFGHTLIYAAQDGRLYGVDLLNGKQWPVTPRYEGIAAPTVSSCGRFVAFLCEQDGRCNVLLTQTNGKTLPIKITDDPWYAFNPVFSPDGSRLAWQEWDEREMPWEQARLKIARFDKAAPHCRHLHELLPPTLVAIIAKDHTSYSSPQFSTSGMFLAFTSDETGWRSLWIADSDGENARHIETGPGEIGQPDWIPGLAAMRWSRTDDYLFTIRRHESRDTLLCVDWRQDKSNELKSEWTTMEALRCRGDTLAFIGSNPSTPPTLVTLDAAHGSTVARAASAVGLLETAALSQPSFLSWKTTGSEEAHGILYAAAGQPGNQRRPLIVSMHGGPTSERSFGWDAQAQYFATRGWHYLIVNYHGSSGYGRAYQDSLSGRWGIADVEDARTGAAHLVDVGLADPQRLVITGGSAGGYTTLMALTAYPEFWAAGVALYGIGNLYELKAGSHRFEVHYEESLIGRLPAAGLLWKERSPLSHARNVRSPVLLFHGTEDKAVPHRQSEEFAEAVRAQGVVAELVIYEGEGHGFLREVNRRDLIERTERFLDKYVICQQK